MKPIFALLTALLFSGLTISAAQAQDRYRLQSGDTLRIEVLEDATLNQDALVRPDGLISIPFSGSVRAGGRTVEQVRATIAARLAPNFASAPNVFVTLDSRAPILEPRPPRTFPVYVLGEVDEPGKIDVIYGTTLLQVFAEMGGFNRFAATKRIQLRRGSKIYNFNYDAIKNGTGTGGTTVMAKGDVIIIPQRRLFE
ncbi:MAG: polysaccharide biosynthesis/export family protein [Sulfitobacter sp.]